MSRHKGIRTASGIVVAAGLIVVALVAMPGAFADRALRSDAAQTVGGQAGAVVGSVGRATAAVACPALEGVADRVACGPSIAWCCAGGSMPGITATGQATVTGSGVQARDQAIRRAVADAKDQAEAAAGAAGVKLGDVLSMQVSTPGYPYPLGIRAPCGPGQFCSATVVSPVPCESGKACPPQPTPVPMETFASVTVTWAVA